MLARLRVWIRAVVRRDEVEREMHDEMQLHLDRAAERLMARGLSAKAAEAEARREFGHLPSIQEEGRDARGVRWLEDAAQDLRYAVRGLQLRPGFALAVIITLGLGVGANATMFGILDRLLFRAPAFMPDVDLVHRVYLSFLQNGAEVIERRTEFPRYIGFRMETRSFDVFAAFTTRRLLVGAGEASRELNVTLASATFFDLFDAPPAAGRYFTADEDAAPGGAQVIVLSYPFWQAEYGGRRDVLGTRVQIDRMIGTVIGVAPEGFGGVGDGVVPAAYVPITAFAASIRGPTYVREYGWTWLELLGRRKRGVTVEQATRDLTLAYQRSWRSDPTTALGPVSAARPRVILASVHPAGGPLANREAKVVTWISGVAVVVLLIACANVANLLLARAVGRRREIALRLALGVRRGRLVRQFLMESLVLAALGGAAGLVLAQWGAGVLRALFFSPEEPTGVLTDGRTLLTSLAATFVVAILTGIAPSAHALRADVARALSAGGRDTGGPRARTRALLLLVQATLSVVLLVGAGLFVRSLQRVQALRLGYDVDPVVFVRANLRGTRLIPAEVASLNDRLLAEVRTIPGVLSATAALSVPFSDTQGRTLYVQGIDSVGKLGTFTLQAGTPEYFQTLGTRILRGRAFDASDDSTSPPVAVVSEGMARTLWPGQDPIGQCIRIRYDTVPCTTVIGVAEEMRIRSLTDTREYAYYLPIAQVGPSGVLFVRVAGDAEDYAGLVQRRLQPLLPGTAYATAVPLRSLVDPNFRSWRFGATMFVAFGALALALAAVGLYSVVAYNVAHRRQEIGVRIALGATRASVVQLVVIGGMRIVISGVIVGSVLALGAGQWVEALLFRQSARDPAVFGVVALVLIGVALIAAAIPALGASRADPNQALRID